MGCSVGGPQKFFSLGCKAGEGGQRVLTPSMQHSANVIREDWMQLGPRELSATPAERAGEHSTAPPPTRRFYLDPGGRGVRVTKLEKKTISAPKQSDGLRAVRLGGWADAAVLWEGRGNDEAAGGPEWVRGDHHRTFFF